MLLQPNGITNSNIHDLDLFVISILIGGLVMRRQFIPLLAFVHISVVLLIFFLLPHDPLFVQEVRVHLNGVTYSALSDTFVLLICGAGIAWLSAWSVDKALQQTGLALGVATLGTLYVALAPFSVSHAFATAIGCQLAITVLLILGSRGLPPFTTAQANEVVAEV